MTFVAKRRDVYLSRPLGFVVNFAESSSNFRATDSDCDSIAEIFILHWSLIVIFWLLQINKDGCGETKSCYSSSDYLVTMKPVGDEDSDDGEVEFELSAKGQWVAIGFNSEKNKMVRHCTHFL